MAVAVKLIAGSQIDRAAFYQLDKALTGENHIGIVDSKRLPSQLAEDVAILGGFGEDQWMPYAVVNAAFLVAGPRYDIDRILEQCRDMSHLCTQKCHPDARVAVVSGSLEQWRTAITSGCRTHQIPSVRSAFNEMYRTLTQLGLRDLFTGLNAVDQIDNTFLLR